MYEQFFAHFGLQRNPFQVSPDSTHYYSTAAHDEVLLQLVSRIEVHQGFMVITGEAGTGKSTVLQYLLDWLKKYGDSSAYIFHSHVNFSDLLQMILEEFGVPFSSSSKRDLLAILKNWLIDRHRAGDSPVILIDEAQSLRNRTLDQLRRLLDLEVQGVRNWRRNCSSGGFRDCGHE
jgi:general secretion pathway protein A